MIFVSCFLCFVMVVCVWCLDSTLQRFALVAFLLLQLLVLLAEVLGNLTTAESTASRVDALFGLLLIIPALFFCKVVSTDPMSCIAWKMTNPQVRRQTI